LNSSELLNNGNFAETIDAILALRQTSASAGDFFNGSESIFIYGAGNCGRDVLNLLKSRNVQVSGFFDANLPVGKVVDGVLVMRPEDPLLSAKVRAVSCVIVAIFNPDVNIRSVVTFLERLGYGRIVTFPKLHRLFPHELGNRFWLTDTAIYDACRNDIIEVYSSWHDEESRNLYRAILSLRCSGDYAYLPEPSHETQYFDPTVAIWNTPLSFIDCGCFTGDTLDNLFGRFGKVASIIAFEPDPDNFLLLADKIRSRSERYAENLALYPCGVWSTTTMLQFNSGGGSSSAVSDKGETSVQCVALDDALPYYIPTLIKMDIEGAELDALSGGAGMIRKHRPSLAISAYHAPEHLWQIVLLLRQWNPGYKFFLRCYGYSGFETVVYAVQG